MEATQAPPPKEQPFTLPDFTQQSAAGTGAQNTDADHKQTWMLALAGLLCVSALLFQFMAFMRLRVVRGPVKLPDLGPLQDSLTVLRDQAARAGRLYDAAFEAATRPQLPLAAPPPALPPVPQRPQPEPAYRPGQPDRVRPLDEAFTTQPPRSPVPFSALVDEYQRVRASPNRDRDVDAFESTYRYTRISCVNFDDLRNNPKATLRFQESPRGWIFIVRQGPQIMAFPWFATDLNQERERLEGIFEYPLGGSGALRVACPAILEQRNAELVMTTRGVLDAND
jgi:hypothetical protein